MSEKTIGNGQSSLPKISEGGETPYLRAQSEFGTQAEMPRAQTPELELQKTESCCDKIKFE